MANCMGCEKHCEYGFVALSFGGYLPRLGDVFYTAYFNKDNMSVVLSPRKISRDDAIAESVKIARLCEHNCFVKNAQSKVK